MSISKFVDKFKKNKANNTDNNTNDGGKNCDNSNGGDERKSDDKAETHEDEASSPNGDTKDTNTCENISDNIKAANRNSGEAEDNTLIYFDFLNTEKSARKKRILSKI